MSEVCGVRLDDGRAVVVKARAGDVRRTRACLEVQRRVEAAGLPCAAPLTDASERDGRIIHAEQWRPGGSVRRDDGPEHAAQAAQVLAAVMKVTLSAGVPPRTLMPNPVWVRWEDAGSGAWPRFDLVDVQQVRTGIRLPQCLKRFKDASRRGFAAPPCLSSSATPTGRHRTCAGEATRSTRSTTGTVSRPSPRQPWWVQRLERSQAPIPLHWLR